MFKIVNRDSARITIASEKHLAMIPVKMFEQAQLRLQKQIKIRRPVVIVVENKTLIFKKCEWRKVKNLSRKHIGFGKDLHELYKWEQRGRFRVQNRRYAIVPSV